MELDVYIEELKLASEYQGEQHYKALYVIGADFETLRIRDEEKRRASKQVILWVGAATKYVAQHHIG